MQPKKNLFASFTQQILTNSVPVIDQIKKYQIIRTKPKLVSKCKNITHFKIYKLVIINCTVGMSKKENIQHVKNYTPNNKNNVFCPKYKPHTG